jgi:hypothetical protein
MTAMTSKKLEMEIDKMIDAEKRIVPPPPLPPSNFNIVPSSSSSPFTPVSRRSSYSPCASFSSS